jgi:hypothetical protein
LKTRIGIWFGLGPSLLLLSALNAAPGADVQAEVGFLLQYIEESGCEFYRNGTWYDGRQARAHLSAKYQYLAGRDQISTTVEFIERVATRSSLTGIPYQIRCQGSAPMGSNQWLSDAIAAYRQANLAPPAP